MIIEHQLVIMSKKVGFVFSEDFYKYNFGSEHPLRPIRLELTYKLMKLMGLLDNPRLKIVQPKMATPEEIYLAHHKEYVDLVKKYSNLPIEQFYKDYPRGHFGLGTMDDPVFPGMYEASALVAGATITAAEMVMNDPEVDIAFNVGGGLHHAHKKMAHGFCIFNDIAIAIQKIRLKHPNLRICYLDIDAHHGDGVQNIFYNDPDILKIDIHQDGRTLFPGTGFFEETGEGEGKGLTVNMPIYPGTYDEAYIQMFDELVPKILDKFKPDLLVSQLGVDTYFTDPLTMLGLSTSGHEKLYKLIYKYSKEFCNGKWLAVGGGGYLMTVVPRSWTMALGIMLDVELPNELPQEWIDFAAKNINDEEIPYQLRDKNYRSEEQLVKNPMYSVRIDEQIRKIEDFVYNSVLKNDLGKKREI